MGTSLYKSIIVGPIHSRRLGISLGINILPQTTKVCTFECIYCECGDTPKGINGTFPTLSQITKATQATLEKLREENKKIDSITFSGNGEPTLHPQFLSIIEHTISLRDKYFPSCKISVLSNATQLHNPDVICALKKVNNRILKLDAGTNELAKEIDRPQSPSYDINRIAKQLMVFKGDFIMQTIFLRGTINGKNIDNTRPETINKWIDLVKKTNPKQIMVYTIDRETPIKTLEKVSIEEMKMITQPLKEEGYDILIAE